MTDKFDFSNIFKKSEDKEKQQNQGKNLKPSVPGPEKDTLRQSSNESVSFSSVIKKQEVTNNLNPRQLYDQTVSLVGQIYSNPAVAEANISGIKVLINGIVDLISAENKELLKLALADYPSLQDYLYYHIVNVCIISCIIALDLGYSHSRMMLLGIAAFFHDIGMTRYIGLVNQPKKLTPQEYVQIQQHPIAGQEILKEIGKELDTIVTKVANQEHERVNGSGYPNGLKDDEIIEYAQIIGLSDVYEAMIHTRPYRGRYSPLETIKKIVTEKDNFKHQLIKILITKVGLFPLGTFVQLNTKEIGQVIRQNPQYPLRPIVNIILDSAGKRLESVREIDLSSNPTVYILGITAQPDNQQSM